MATLTQIRKGKRTTSKRLFAGDVVIEAGPTKKGLPTVMVRGFETQEDCSELVYCLVVTPEEVGEMLKALPEREVERILGSR